MVLQGTPNVGGGPAEQAYYREVSSPGYGYNASDVYAAAVAAYGLGSEPAVRAAYSAEAAGYTGLLAVNGVTTQQQTDTTVSKQASSSNVDVSTAITPTISTPSTNKNYTPYLLLGLGALFLIGLSR